MTNKEKQQLLLKDICARLPYGVQCEIGGLQYGPYTFTANYVEYLIAGRTFKPYLRPMSSMTENEKVAFDKFICLDEGAWLGKENGYLNQAKIMSGGIDWLLERHFDYRGLIEKGLALEAPNDMYKTE